MIKYAICGDVHWSQYSSIVRRRGEKYSIRLHNLIQSMNWFEEQAKDCDKVIYLGDTFDRTDLNAEEITALQSIKFCDKPHIFLTGNHESNMSSLEFSTAKIFESIDAEVVSNVSYMPINDKVEAYFIPYKTNDNMLPLSSYTKSASGKKKIVFSHNDIAGIQYGKFLSQSGFDVNDILNNCTLYINGHLHNSAVINDRIILVGNLTGQNFTEDAFNHNHYIYIITIDDDGNIELEPRINPYAFNFYKVHIECEKDFEILKSLNNNAVVSIVCNSNLINQLKELLKSLVNIIDYKIIVNYDSVIMSGETLTIEPVKDFMKQFVDFVQTKIESSNILNEELVEIMR